MKNIKRISAIVLSALLVLACVAFAACKEGEEEHIHTFETQWSYDETNHWLAATCGHDVRSSEAAHVYLNGSNKCQICDYEKPIIDDGENTYFEAENGLLSEGCRLDTTSEARGGKAVSYFRDVLKASVTFYIDSSVAENDVEMTLRFASACEYVGETDHDMSEYDMLTVNGAKASLTGTVKARMTGWFEWNDVTAKVNLKQGPNVIVVHYDYNGNIKDEQPGWGLCLNFDYISLKTKNAALTASDPAGVETGITLTVDDTRAKTYYTVGDSLIKDGLSVALKKLDGTSSIAAADDYTLSCDMTYAGEKEVTLSCHGFTAKYPITVYETTEAIVTALDLNTDNVKKEYNAHAALDLSGLTATVTYDDGSVRGINIRDLTADEVDTSEEAESLTVTLRYGGLSATYEISVMKYAHTLKLEAEVEGVFTECMQEGNHNVNRFWAESNSKLTFYVESSTAETEAKIVLRLACACEEAGGQNHDMSQISLLKVNGEYVALEGTVVNRMTEEGGGSWSNYTDIVALGVALKKGVNLIALEFDDNTIHNRLNIDYITVSTISAQLSSRVYQAEDAQNNCDGETTEAASGTGGNNLMHIEKAADTITWKVNSDEEREVRLVLRLATRKASGNGLESIDVGNLSQYELLTVNNENVAIDGELRDGVWLNFSEFVVTVRLTAGENTIVLHGCADESNPTESIVKLQVDCLAVIF